MDGRYRQRASQNLMVYIHKVSLLAVQSDVYRASSHRRFLRCGSAAAGWVAVPLLLNFTAYLVRSLPWCPPVFRSLRGPHPRCPPAVPTSSPAALNAEHRRRKISAARACGTLLGSRKRHVTRRRTPVGRLRRRRDRRRETASPAGVALPPSRLLPSRPLFTAVYLRVQSRQRVCCSLLTKTLPQGIPPG